LIDTKIQVGFIVMKHNEHEVEQAKKELKELGADEVVIISPCVRTVEQGKEFLPTDDRYWIYDRKAFADGVLVPKKVPHNRCWWIYYSTVVLWNGDVVPCCRDACGKYVMGNLLNQPFKDIWNSWEYKELRWRIAADQSKIDLCRLCSGYGIARLY